MVQRGRRAEEWLEAVVREFGVAMGEAYEVRLLRQTTPTQWESVCSVWVTPMAWLLMQWGSAAAQYRGWPLLARPLHATGHGLLRRCLALGADPNVRVGPTRVAWQRGCAPVHGMPPEDALRAPRERAG